MGSAGVKVELDRHHGFSKLLGVGNVFIAENIQLADLYIRWRQADKVFEPGRGDDRRNGVGTSVRA
jgi:hypothetical protein